VGWLGESSFALLFRSALPSGPGATVAAHVASTAAAFALITSIHVVVGELVPKNLAITHAERLLLLLATPLEVIHRLFRPARRLLAASSAALLRCFGQGRQGAPRALSEDELKIILEDSHDEGVVTDAEARIIARAFEFADKRAAEIMVPAEDVHYLSLARSFEENLALVRRGAHVRYPLCSGDLDSVVGVVSIKDAWSLLGAASNAVWEQSARLAVRVPFDLPRDAILLRLQQGRSQLAVVRDADDRRTLGIVTLEDVIESLVGDVREPKLNQRKA
jgi:CBS domain containing-hemolysin-like protein